jgi:hypothetical protein
VIALPVLGPVRQEPEGTAEGEGLAKEGLPSSEREAGQVVSVQMEDVEDVEEDGHSGPSAPTLKPGEGGLAPAEATTPSTTKSRGLAGQRLDDLGVPAHLQTVPREQPDPGAVAKRQATDAVDLALEHPVRIGDAAR